MDITLLKMFQEMEYLLFGVDWENWDLILWAKTTNSKIIWTA